MLKAIRLRGYSFARQGQEKVPQSQMVVTQRRDDSEGPATYSCPLWGASQVSRSAFVLRDGKAEGHAESKTPLSSEAAWMSPGPSLSVCAASLDRGPSPDALPMRCPVQVACWLLSQCSGPAHGCFSATGVCLQCTQCKLCWRHVVLASLFHSACAGLMPRRPEDPHHAK